MQKIITMLNSGDVSGKVRRRKSFPLINLLQCIVISSSCFYIGLFVGTLSGQNTESCSTPKPSMEADVDQNKINSISPISKDDSIQKLASVIIETPREDFLKLYDYGVPIKPNERGLEHGLILFNDLVASNPSMASIIDKKYETNIAKLTDSCDVMNVATVKIGGNENLCTAIINSQSDGLSMHHMLRWMRIKEKNNNKDGEQQLFPFIKAGRGKTINGANQFIPPTETQMKNQLDILKLYLENIEDILDQLKQILISTHPNGSKNNDIIVLTGNFGQSTLLINFVCNARAHKIDLSKVVVFPTDNKMLDVAQNLGLNVFHHPKLFSTVSSFEEEASDYGNRVFAKMMYPKVVSCQLVIALGYNVLFQDLDVVYYDRNPLEFWRSTTISESHNYDIYFQEDGAHSLRYSPYSANSGFFYCRANERTKNFFNQFLFQGISLIFQSGSHQQVMISFLTEHASLFGLRVKILNDELFPGGFHFHRKREFMKKLMVTQKQQQEKEKETQSLRSINDENSALSWIFHMSWTKNKSYKIRFMKQMGIWYVKDMCIDQSLDGIQDSLNNNIIVGNSGEEEEVSHKSVVQHACCSVEPIISCHYRDKPSVVPCPNSPQMDPNTMWAFGKSVDFW